MHHIQMKKVPSDKGSRLEERIFTGSLHCYSSRTLVFDALKYCCWPCKWSVWVVWNGMLIFIFALGTYFVIVLRTFVYVFMPRLVTRLGICGLKLGPIQSQANNLINLLQQERGTHTMPCARRGMV
jgi:hypothetical protein